MKWCPDDSLGWGQKVAGCLCGRDILAECHLLDLLFLCLAGPSSRCRSAYLGEGRGTWLDELAGTVDGSEVWHENQLRLVGYLPLFTGFGIQPNGGYPLGFLNHQNIVVSPQLLIHNSWRFIRFFHRAPSGDRILSFTSQCRCNNGAFAPHPAHDQELLSTVSAVQIACLLEEPKILGDLAEVSAYASRLRRWWKGLIQPMRLVVERIRIVTIKHTCTSIHPQE